MRVIFEAKSISESNELSQIRAALAQLLEYRFFYGAATDGICLVTDAPVSERRLRFLDAMGISLLWFDGREFRAYGATGDCLLTPGE